MKTRVKFAVLWAAMMVGASLGEAQAQDLKGAVLQDFSRDLYAQIISSVDTSAAEKALQVEIAERIIKTFGSQNVQNILATWPGWDLERLIHSATDVSGSLTSIGVNAAESMVENAIVEIAAELATKMLFASPPMSDVHVRLRSPLSAAVKAAIVEMYDLQSAGRDPSVLLGKVLDRTHEAVEIYQGTRLLAQAERRALVATALNIASAAEIGVLVGGVRGRRVIDLARESLSDSMRGAVGGDDEVAVEAIFSHALDALVAHHRGDTSGALQAYRQAVGGVRRGGNINPFSAITNPLDWGVAAMNWGKDSPYLAVEILRTTTALGELETNGADAARNAPPPILYSSLGEAQAYAAYRERFTGDDIRRIAAAARKPWRPTTENLGLAIALSAGLQPANVPDWLRASFLELLSGVGRGENAEALRNAIAAAALSSFADQVGLTMDELRLFSDARNIHQRVQHSANPKMVDVAGQSGWRLLPPEKSSFHATGYDAADIRKYVHENGCEYVFSRTATDWAFVNDGINSGTFNYASDEDLVVHTILDVLPWIVWGVGKEERSSVADRFGVIGWATGDAAAALFDKLKPGVRALPVTGANQTRLMSACPGIADYDGIASVEAPQVLADDAEAPDKDDNVNSQFVQAFSAYLGAASRSEEERGSIYTSVAATFAQIVRDHPTTRQARAIIERRVPGIDFALLDAASSAQGTDDAAKVEASVSWGPEIVVPPDHQVWKLQAGDWRGSTAETLAPYGLSGPQMAFFEAYGDSSSDVLAATFVELGVIDLVRTGGINPGASAWFRQPAYVNGLVGVMRAEAGPSNLQTAFRDGTSLAVLNRQPKVIPIDTKVAHRLLPGGGQRFVEIVPFVGPCRACEVTAVAVAFVDFDSGGAFISRRYVGISEPQASEGLNGRGRDWGAVDFITDLAGLQYRLNSLGYDAGEMDGYPGPQTRDALMAFQAEHCVAPTGQPDAATTQALALADGLSAPCAGAAIPRGLGSNDPLLPGMYVSDPAFCAREAIDEAIVYDVQRIVRPGMFTRGYHGACVARRADIRGGVTLFRGSCSEGPEEFDASWTLDVETNESFREVSGDGSDMPSNRFVKCADGSLLRRSWSAWFDGAESASIELNSPLIPLPAEDQERTAVIQAMRPIAEAIFGPPVEFTVIDLRVKSALAYADVYARRPGGAEIDLRSTPGFARGEVQPMDPNPTKISALLRSESGGNWRIERHVVSASEAFWLEDCATWGPLFPETCGGTSEGATSYFAPAGFSWLQTHSRADRAEAVALATSLRSQAPGVRVFRAANGWYAVVARAVANNDAVRLSEIIRESGLPAEATLVSGETYVEAVPLAPSDASFPIAAADADPVTGPLIGSSNAGAPAPNATVADSLRLAEASAVQIAALLRSAGVHDENARMADSAAEAEIVTLAAHYTKNTPSVETPDLPAFAGEYDPTSGSLRVCVKNDLLFSATSFDEMTWGPRLGVMKVDLPYITAFGSLPQICNLSNLSAVSALEALHGTGQMERFDPAGAQQAGLRLKIGPDAAQRLIAASAKGALRVGYTCRMEFREQVGTRPAPYDYRRIGTCVMAAMSLSIVDYLGGSVERIRFIKGLNGVIVEGGFVAEPLQTADVAAAEEPDAPPPARAPRSFETSETGEDAVRQIIKDLVGGPAEVTLGYQNAFPFKSEPSKVLAIAVFGALPQDEITKVAGTEAGYGSFILKSWSTLNRYYFIEDPEPGLASAIVGKIEDIRILSVREVVGSSCEWSVTYRIWLTEKTPFGDALSAISAADGLTFTTCLRTTRNGYDIVSQTHVD
ncbi:peptidoglycan-binding protein [Pseudotabrizicola sediminis]|uniref:Peptidoglycan-binding protein n=1 Tax=Pseudotabrizicola sediminis TaxID=2486418 RepID=A0ABY2KRN5_9RHOB|nr:peptidoglycan-binding domain-containing protein [Pseudotabrizicola sediminis]TGD45445.1 peptidoglycan-binding protein [Pseudotabrizicola sediminis]